MKSDSSKTRNIEGLKGSVLAVIPARAGSKGIPGKNLRVLAGKSLLQYTIEFAQAADCFNRILLTTDGEDIAAAGKALGAEVPFLRPPELAQDDTPMLPVLQHAVRHVIATGWTPEIIVLLQPTAPFRHIEDLTLALALLNGSPQAESLVSVEVVPHHFSPHYVMKIDHGQLLPFLPAGEKLTRRQDVPEAYSRNGQFYLTRRSVLLEKNSIYGDKCLPYVTRHAAVNLDTLEDWEAAERLAASHKH